jgi:hypothetical protein
MDFGERESLAMYKRGFVINLNSNIKVKSRIILTLN